MILRLSSLILRIKAKTREPDPLIDVSEIHYNDELLSLALLTRTQFVDEWFESQDWPYERIDAQDVLNWMPEIREPEQIAAMINGKALGSLVANDIDAGVDPSRWYKEFMP